MFSVCLHILMYVYLLILLCMSCSSLNFFYSLIIFLEMDIPQMFFIPLDH